MQNAKDRKIPYLVGAFCYYMIASILEKLQLPREAYYFLLASTIVIIVHLVLLSFMKPSAHMGGIAGFTALLLALSLKYQTNLIPIIAFSVLLSGFLASARLYLKAHTNTEIIVGFTSSLILVFLLVYFG